MLACWNFWTSSPMFLPSPCLNLCIHQMYMGVYNTYLDSFPCIRMYAECMLPISDFHHLFYQFRPVYNDSFRVYLCIQRYTSCILPSFGPFETCKINFQPTFIDLNLPISFGACRGGRLKTRIGF